METREARPGELGGFVVNGLELREAPHATYKDIDEDKRQVLVEFPHDVVDSYKTKFGTRAFSESFERHLPTMCWQHDIKDPIGHALQAQVGPRVNEIRGQFDNFDAVPHAKRAFHQIQSGTIEDFSFGFRNAHYERKDRAGVRRISKAFMAEFSPVTIGSIPGAKAVGLREDGNTVEYELDQILRLRESNLMTVETAASLIKENYPEMAEHITIVPLQARDTSQTDGKPNDNDEQPQWTASDAGFATATGPNGEAMAVQPAGDSHIWSVTGQDGSSKGSGKADNPEDAKRAANELVGNRSDQFVWDREKGIDANTIRAAVEFASPEIAKVIEACDIDLKVPGDSGNRNEMEVDEFVGSLATGVRAAAENAVSYFDDVDLSTLPAEVQDGIFLVRAAAVGAEGLTDALGIEYEAGNADETPEEFRDDDEELQERAAASGMSTKPWGDFKESDYSDEQYKKAALIKGKDKSDSHLPIAEPDGTLNVHGIAAAAGRLDATDASPEQKKAAAKTLMGHYGKMGKKVPPSVLKHASGNGGKRDEEAELQTRAAEQDAQRAAALAQLDAMAAKKPAA